MNNKPVNREPLEGKAQLPSLLTHRTVYFILGVNYVVGVSGPSGRKPDHTVTVQV